MLKKNNKIDLDSNFRLASISKQFTGMALAILEETGKLNPNNNINEYITNLPSYCEQIQIKHLIHHMSGLPDYYMELCSTDESRKILTNIDIVEFLNRRTKLNFRAGSKFEYSNTGYNLLGKLIENISGISYKYFIENNIFKKIGMKDSTVISSPELKIKNKVIGYSAWPIFEVNDYNSGNYLLGEDGIYSSITDIYKWIIAIEQNLLVSQKTQNKIFFNALTDNLDEVNYGYGWFIENYHGHKMYFHSGSWVGFNNMIVYFPENKLWFVSFANSKGISSWDNLAPLINHYLDLNI